MPYKGDKGDKDAARPPEGSLVETRCLIKGPNLPLFLFQATEVQNSSRLLAFCKAPEPVLDFGPERGSAKGTMADLGPLIRHLVSTRLPSGGRAASLSPLYGTRRCV